MSHTSDAVAGLAGRVTEAHKALQGREGPEALYLVCSLNMETVLLPLTMKSGLCGS